MAKSTITKRISSIPSNSGSRHSAAKADRLSPVRTDAWPGRPDSLAQCMHTRNPQDNKIYNQTDTPGNGQPHSVRARPRPVDQHEGNPVRQETSNQFRCWNDQQHQRDKHRRERNPGAVLPAADANHRPLPFPLNLAAGFTFSGSHNSSTSRSRPKWEAASAVIMNASARLRSTAVILATGYPGGYRPPTRKSPADPLLERQHFDQGRDSEQTTGSATINHGPKAAARLVPAPPDLPE